MAPPYQVGRPQRSLVRANIHRSAKSSAAIQLDLGRVSSVANSVRIDPLPAALAGPRNATSDSPTGSKRKLDEEAEGASRWNGSLRPRKVPTGKVQPTTRKQQRTTDGPATSTTEGSTLHTQRATPLTSTATRPQLVATDHQGVILQPLDTRGILQPSNVASVCYVRLDVLLTERDNIMKENDRLKRQITLFQEVFKNKELLASVVDRLGMGVSVVKKATEQATEQATQQATQ